MHITILNTLPGEPDFVGVPIEMLEQQYEEIIKTYNGDKPHQAPSCFDSFHHQCEAGAEKPNWPSITTLII